MQLKRDETIDVFRGFAMLWVVVIHNIYHLGYFDRATGDILRSYVLFEMPLFFFITGASNSYSKNNGTIKFYISRLQRILIPYWIYGLICFIVNFVHSWHKESASFTLTQAIKWIIPWDKQPSALPYLAWSLWFLPVYLGVIILFPLLRKLKESKFKLFSILPFVALPIAVFLLPHIKPEPENANSLMLWDWLNKILF
jgi:surface polysaccharide O-acyltransferase-like enzyme